MSHTPFPTSHLRKYIFFFPTHFEFFTPFSNFLFHSNLPHCRKVIFFHPYSFNQIHYLSNLTD